MKSIVISLIKRKKWDFIILKFYFKLIQYLNFRNIEFDESLFQEKHFSKGEGEQIFKGEGEQNVCIPKIIWIFWADPNLPRDISLCVNRIIDLNPTYEVNVLNKNSLNHFVNIDLTRSDMPLANISDLIRLKLLQKFGGVWLDASIIMNKPIDYFIGKNNNFDLIAFYRNRITINPSFPVLESWFLIAPKNSKYINEWLNNFILVEEIGSKKYFQYVSNRSDYDELKQNISPPEYLIVYLANQITMKEVKNCKLKLFLSDTSAYLIQDSLGWRSFKTVSMLTLINAPKVQSPLYKLTSGDRKYLNIIFDNNLLNMKSIFGMLESNDY